MRPGRDAEHTPPSSAEVKKELSYTSTHPMGPPGPVTGFPLALYRRKWSRPDLKCYLGTCLDSLRIITRSLSQNIQCAGQYFKCGTSQICTGADYLTGMFVECRNILYLHYMTSGEYRHGNPHGSMVGKLHL